MWSGDTRVALSSRKSHNACLPLVEPDREDREKNTYHICSSFLETLHAFRRCASRWGADRTTMRPRQRDNYRGHYTNTYAVLHTNHSSSLRLSTYVAKIERR